MSISRCLFLVHFNVLLYVLHDVFKLGLFTSDGTCAFRALEVQHSFDFLLKTLISIKLYVHAVLQTFLLAEHP